MLLGTAGHVDHGKTTLIRVLTGVDTDRLAEEQRRGITIELGFARWTLPDGRTLSVVDVPGHEKLVRTMLVGAGGMDAVLLAVAADEGVMPQTREHLAACAVLGIRRGVVAVTCADRVDDVPAAVDRIAGELAGTVLQDAEIIPVSALRGDGIEALTAAVARLLDAWIPPAPGLPVYLPIDRVFSVEGYGTVVTGALVRGQVAVGESLAVVPGPPLARVRGLHVHDAPVEQATPGTRLAVNLAAERAQVERGAVLCTPGTVGLGRVLDVEVQWCDHLAEPLTRARGLAFHLGADRAVCEVRADSPVDPGGWGTARLRIDRDLPLPPGARFVLRGPPDLRHGGVVGGGRIIDARPPLRRVAATRVALAAATPADAVQVLVEEAGAQGLDPIEVSLRLPLPPRPSGPPMFAPSALAAALQGLVVRVAQWHAVHPELPGLPAAEALATPLNRAAFAAAEGALVREGQVLRLPGHAAHLDDADARMAGKLLKSVGKAGLEALTEGALAERFPEAPAGQVARVLKHLERIGRVVRTGGFVFPAREANEVRRRVAQELVGGRTLPVAAFKTWFDLSRKYAIPLLEWLDDLGVTRREGDERVAGPRARAVLEEIHE
jgi:selenocysteine-specific elongation factor